jgi:short-subunit dehydrogenase
VAEHPFAVITGASRGIGAAYARELAARGYDLLLVARDVERLTALAQQLHARHGVIAEIEWLDLAQADAAHRLYAAARLRRQHTGLLINNAGFGLFGPFVAQPLPRIQEMLRVHVATVVETIRLFLPGMVERRSGTIITVASTAGLFSTPYFAEYSATKAFLIRFCESLAEEVRADGVRIQVCCPGTTTDTNFHATAGFRLEHRFGADSASRVAAVSLDALADGPVVLMIGRRGRWLERFARWAPRAWLAREAGRYLRRRLRVAAQKEEA